MCKRLPEEVRRSKRRIGDPSGVAKDVTLVKMHRGSSTPLSSTHRFRSRLTSEWFPGVLSYRQILVRPTTYRSAREGHGARVVSMELQIREGASS